MTRSARRKATVRALAATRGTTYTAALREHERHPAVVHLVLHPGTSTSDLVAATGMSVLDLHRTARAAGFGQRADGTWWLSEHDERVAQAAEAHLPTAPARLGVILGHTGDLVPVHLTGGRTWAVTGIAGVGKTTLVRRLIDAAREQHRPVYRISADDEIGGLAGEIATWRELTHRFPAAMADLLERAAADPGAPLVIVDDIPRVLHGLAEREPRELDDLTQDEQAQVAAGARLTDTQRARAALARVVDTYDDSGRTVVLAGVVDLERHDPRLHPWLGWASRTVDVRFGEPWHERVGVLHDGGKRTTFALQPLEMEVRALAPGERVQFTDSGRWWRVRAVSASGRYVALSSPHNVTGEDFYTVIDRARAIRAADDRVLGSGWRTDEDFVTNLRRIESGDLRLSVRNRVPADIAAVRAPDPGRKPSPPARLAAPAGLQRVTVPVAATDTGTATLGSENAHVLVAGPRRFAAAWDLIDALQGAGWFGEASLDPASGSEAALATASTDAETTIVVDDALAELARRYELLRRHAVAAHHALPDHVRVEDRFLVIDVDHAAAVPDLEVSLNRIARTGRAAGMHLVAIAERPGAGMAWRTDVAQLQTGADETSWRNPLGEWTTVTGPAPSAREQGPLDLDAGVVLVAGAEGGPVRFDLTRGLWVADGLDTPFTLWRLLADQALAGRRTAVVVSDGAGGALARAFPGTANIPLADLARTISRADETTLLIVVEPCSDMLAYDRQQADAWNMRVRALQEATSTGAWIVVVHSQDVYGSPSPVEHLGARLSFGRYRSRLAHGREGARKRLLPVDGAGLARTAPDGPLELVRAYC
jgi:hypothetical protein